MTNPSNAIGTNGAYGGRTSVNAFNDVLGAFSRGVLSGWECVPNSGLTVSLGGNGTTRDVAIAEDNAGNRTTIDNISGSPVDVTMSAAPAANSRIDAIVAYVDNPPTGTSTVADNPAACGIIAVDGIAAGSPVAPDDNAIRTAITADGASGSTAYYVVLATITIATGTTDIVAGDIMNGSNAELNNYNFGYSTSETATGYTWVDGSIIYKKTVNFGTLPNATTKNIAHGIQNLANVIEYDALAYNGTRWTPLPIVNVSGENAAITIDNQYITIITSTDRRTDSAYVTIYYTKTQ